MKQVKLFTALILLLVATGCISEKREDCIAGYNALLTFEYSALDAGLFIDNIKSVDLVFFDASGKYIMQQRATEEMLRQFQGMYLTLEPGVYHVVAWGNNESNTTYCSFTEGVTDFGDCHIEVAQSAQHTGDRIYYAPGKTKPGTRSDDTRASGDLGLYRIEIPYGKVVSKTLDFVRAHRTVNVYVKGLDDTDGITVEAHNLWSRYDFFFNNTGQCCRFGQPTVQRQIDGKTYHATTFHSGLGTVESNMRFDIYRGLTTRASLATSVNLRQFLLDNPTNNTEDIDILVEFNDFGVSISVPTWGESPVQPGV